MEPIRVAQIVGKMNTGGVEIQMANYYRAMDKQRIQFDFIYDSDSTHPPIDELQALGARFYAVAPYKYIVKYMRDVYRIIKQNKYEIVHVNLNTMSVFPLCAAWLAGAKVRICHNHSTAHKGEGKRIILKYLLRPFGKIFATDYFACGALAGRWMFGETAFAAGRVTLINNAIDTRRFAYDAEKRADIRNQLGLTDEMVIGHVGRFSLQKNHAFLLDIFFAVQQHIENAKLLVVGEGELLEPFMQKAKQLGIQDKIIHAAFCKDVEKYYQAMDLFLLPSLFEGLPIVGVEAQAAGLPCIFSDKVTQAAKLVENTMFVPLEETPEAWAQKIIEHYNNTARGLTPQPVIEAGYDIKTEANRLADTYEKLVDKE